MNKKLVLVLVLVLSILPLGVKAAELTFAWDATVSTDAVGYRVYQSNSAVVDKTKKVCDTKELTCKVTVTDGTYYFAATAYDKAGNESDFSNVVSATIDTIPPIKPANLTVKGVNIIITQ